MSSCQDFLMPAAEGGVAVGMEPRLPRPSFIKLGKKIEDKEKMKKRDVSRQGTHFDFLKVCQVTAT